MIKKLTVAIPTFNRAKYLDVAIKNLVLQLTPDNENQIEILISDNASEDDTQSIVQNYIDEGWSINYVRNKVNLGWGRNFQQCIELANTDYILLLSDDDILEDRSLNQILTILNHYTDVGVIFLKPYGFDKNHKSERPKRKTGSNICKEYSSSNNFLIRIVKEFTLLSTCVFNTSIIGKDKYNSIAAESNFLHLYYILDAIFSHQMHFYINDYLVGSKRNNSSNYDFSKVFISELWAIINYFEMNGLNKYLERKLKNRMLFGYYPFYFLEVRKDRTQDTYSCIKTSDLVFKNNFYYKFWCRPILTLPKFFWYIWGLFTVMTGRLFTGEGDKLLRLVRLKLKWK